MGKQAELILAAFAAELARRDWADFSIPDVARAAGVSVRTVYHHFPNRDAQLEAVARWLDDQIVSGIERFLAARSGMGCGPGRVGEVVIRPRRRRDLATRR